MDIKGYGNPTIANLEKLLTTDAEKQKSRQEAVSVVGNYLPNLVLKLPPEQESQQMQIALQECITVL